MNISLKSDTNFLSNVSIQSNVVENNLFGRGKNGSSEWHICNVIQTILVNCMASAPKDFTQLSSICNYQCNFTIKW